MIVEKFKNIFSGLERAHGIYIPGEINDKGKKGGVARIKKAEVTTQLWQDHLDGKDPSLGIIPIMDDGNCRWGCIDIDDYKLDHKKLLKQIKQLELPLISCRSKSGGAHVFLFIDGLVPAKAIRKKLNKFAFELGRANCEIFPKQDMLHVEKGDTGNFLNLPYHGGDESFRYAYDDKLNALTVEKFISLVDENKVTPEDFEKLEPKKKKKTQGLLPDGPPCIEKLMETKVHKNRNLTMFHVATYARKKFANDIVRQQDFLFDWHDKYIAEPLSGSELNGIINSNNKKDYGFKCKEDPMCGVCKEPECFQREFGKDFSNDYQITDLQKYDSDEPVWFLNFIMGDAPKRLSLDTEQLFDQRKFRKKCMDAITKLPNKLRDDVWVKKIQDLLDECDIIETDQEITKAGEFDLHLNNFILDQGTTSHKEELLIGMVLKLDDKLYFKPESLLDYLNKKRFTGFSKTEMLARLNNDLKGGTERRHIKGNTSAYLWWVPEIVSPVKELPVPEDMKKKEPF